MSGDAILFTPIDDCDTDDEIEDWDAQFGRSEVIQTRKKRFLAN